MSPRHTGPIQHLLHTQTFMLEVTITSRISTIQVANLLNKLYGAQPEPSMLKPVTAMALGTKANSLPTKAQTHFQFSFIHSQLIHSQLIHSLHGELAARHRLGSQGIITAVANRGHFYFQTPLTFH